MPRADQPSTPADDLAAVAKSGGAKFGVLTAELAAFCQSGISIILGSRNRSGRIVVGRGIACAVGADGLVRLVVRRPSNRTLLEAIDEGGAVAVTFTRPETHRAIQLKARGARIVAFSPADKTLAKSQCANFRRELVSVDYTPEFAAAYCRWDETELCALEFTPEQVFVQTPGPGAGSVLVS